MKSPINNNLEERIKIWVALSDLFLDTDVTPFYESISRVCAESNYSADELKYILLSEVAPVCGINLLSVAGEWTGFDEEWLVDNICNRTYKKPAWKVYLLNPLGYFWIRRYTKDDWQMIEKLMTERRLLISD